MDGWINVLSTETVRKQASTGGPENAKISANTSMPAGWVMTRMPES